MFGSATDPGRGRGAATAAVAGPRACFVFRLGFYFAPLVPVVTSRPSPMQTFRLAPMSTAIRTLTILLSLLPVGFFIGALTVTTALFAPLFFICLIYAWVWLRFRPTAFVVRPDVLEVVWPLKRRTLSRDGIREVRLMDAAALHREVGWGARVGAGGVWGGFGWFWTQHRGIVQMYVSRTDGFVWIERGRERPWLITPERPEEFVRQLTQSLRAR